MLKIKTYRLGIIAPHTLTRLEILEHALIEKLPHIAHIITNNLSPGGEVVQQFAKKYLIPYTVYPISQKSGGVLISNARIIGDSDFVYILDDGGSQNARNVIFECETRGKKYRLLVFQSPS